MIKYAFAYLRVSGKGQVEGDGFDRQIEAIRSFAEIHGIVIQQVYREEGVSGTVECMDRPVFAEMMGHIARDREKGHVIVILVERMDRLARDLMVQEFILTECRKLDVPLYSVDRGVPVDMATNDGDPTQKLIRQIMGALAEWEKTMLVHKLRASRQRVKAAAGKCEGRKAFGDKPGEQAIVDYIASMRNEGMSWPRICMQLNLGGSTTRKGTKWTPGSIESVMSNRAKRKEASMK